MTWAMCACICAALLVIGGIVTGAYRLAAKMYEVDTVGFDEENRCPELSVVDDRCSLEWGHQGPHKTVRNGKDAWWLDNETKAERLTRETQRIADMVMRKNALAGRGAA